ncbi:MAG: hypothetical protein O4859_30995, partial [Trichodesmium sp. St18_bin1]|nr:hypothetical protein [Trichodesmium sp. St18_bin1]
RSEKHSLFGIASFNLKVPNVGIFIFFSSVTNTLLLELSTVKLQLCFFFLKRGNSAFILGDLQGENALKIDDD